MLFVDDSVNFRDNNIAQLIDAGFNVTEADSEKKAMELIGTQKFGIVVTDLVMDHPDSGFILAYHIKRKYSGRADHHREYGQQQVRPGFFPCRRNRNVTG